MAEPTVSDFLETVYGHGNGWVHLSTTNRQLAAVKCSDVADLAEKIAGQTNVYLSAAVIGTDKGSGRSGRIEDQDASELTALWADLDRAGEPGHKTTDPLWTRDDMRKLWEWLPIHPTAVVDSAGGWWFYYVLTEPIPFGEDGRAEMLLARWALLWEQIGQRFERKVDPVFNPSRIARAPGSINGKIGLSRPVEIKSLDPDRRYTFDALDELLPTTEPPTRYDWKPSAGNGERPGDTYNRDATVDSMVALLEHHGFHSPRPKGFRVDLTRAGKQARDGHSVSVWPDASVTFWSSAAEALPGAVGPRDGQKFPTYDSFGAFAHIEHRGDFEAAARALLPDSPTIRLPRKNDRPGLELDDCCIPLDVWGARPELDHIRQAAWSRGRSPDAVLAATLTRVAADTRHTVRLPAIVGAPCGLSLLAAIAGPPGTGKSTCASIAGALLPARVLSIETDGVPPGSGEGLIELLFEWVKEPDPDSGKPIRVHRQVRHNAYMYVDEGETLAKLAGRQSGSTLLPNLRTAFTSGTLGSSNASQDRKRIIPAGQAVYGVVLGIQPELAGPLFDEAGAGTPQRILWASTTVPTPEPVDRPDWPGPIERKDVDSTAWSDHQTSGAYIYHELGIPAAVATEVAERDHHRQQYGAEPLDEHQDLIQLKVAATLALLRGSLDLDLDDWQIAARICHTSRQVRDQLADHLRARAEDQEAATATRLARRQVEVAARTAEWFMVDTARKLAQKVHDEPGDLTSGKLRNGLSAKRKEVFADAFEHAKAEGWIVEKHEPGQGTAKQRLYPGDTKP